MPALQVAVVGGGWAGLAAALEATSLGAQVNLFEMAPQLGGRARSVQTDGLVLDNGQHIMIGAYVETLRIMRMVGVDLKQAFLRTPLRLLDASGDGLVLPGGHPMLAFARGVLGRRGWTLRERLALLQAATGWMLRGFSCPDGMTVGELVRSLPAAVQDGLIDPLCVAALNTPSRSASAKVFLRVIRDALFSGQGSADLLLPRLRLGDLLPSPALDWLMRSGATVQVGRRVERIERSGTWQVDGRAFDAVILACSAAEASRLAAPTNEAWAAQAGALGYEPIVTVYMRCDGTVLPEPMLVLPSDEETRPAQFVFDHGQLGGSPGLLAFVISGAAPWLERGTDATRDATLAQAKELLHRHLKAPPVHIRNLTEKRATFRCVPELDRPAGHIAPGLIAAGDYIAGPYPATIEGAVRSAIAAARQAVSAERMAPPAAPQ
ncbi:hydroxysqualene dehydroxylase HpnE [Piscinibacter terrae]|uniref:hydroxysqualene dehydroxylase HpnE n=1 Tax=Piscinibacter terrae TaxID=2496871 RepID=UPI001F15876B|nr:hydroxysqualene dehydroxylase HpnE [Albitalea terrae]